MKKSLMKNFTLCIDCSARDVPWLGSMQRIVILLKKSRSYIQYKIIYAELRDLVPFVEL